MLLFVPGVAAVSITSEKEAGTLEMLYASRLSPLSIALGKIGGAMAFPLMLLLAGAPFVAMLYWRGDVALDTLASAYLILLLTAVFLAAGSMAVSAVCRQSATALVITYVALLILCGGVMVPALLMLETQQGEAAQALHYTRSLSPVAAMLSILTPAFNDLGGANRGLAPAWQVFVPLALAVSVGSLVLVTLKLGKPPLSAERTVDDGTPRSLARRLMFIIDDKKQRKPMGSLNPLFYKEPRTNQLRSGRWMIRISYGTLALAMGLALMALYGGSEYGDLLQHVVRVLVTLQIGIVALVSPSLTSSSISTELELGTFETLRLTRLRGGQIFWGKFAPAFLPALLPVLAMAPAYGALCYINTAYLDMVARVLPVVILAVAVCCAIGLACSSLVDNTARATVASYIAVAVLFLAPALPWIAMGERLPVEVGRWLAMPSPLVTALNQLPDSPPAIRSLWAQHLITFGAIGLAALVIARVRLTTLLRRG
jgi:ABC-type Na+ efflux pump permease subunit